MTRSSLRRPLLVVVPVAVVAVLFAAFGALRSLDGQRIGVPVPLPVYEIEAVSGSHTASLANLRLGQPGALQAPAPVDVDGDLVPDVTVEVNLVHVEGALFNPPQPGQILAPNIRISRILPGAPLNSVVGRKSPPLRINVKLTVADVLGGPSTVFRFGYDTKGGGSIPTEFQAVVSGLDTFFNPVQAVVDTKSSLRNSGSPDISYEGPLALVLGVQKASFDVKADVNYRPWPDAVRVRYSSDDAGQHLAYAHGISNQVNLRYNKVVDGNVTPIIPGELPEVDLRTVLRMTDGADELKVDARVDRLPRSLTTDFAPGRIDYRARTDGRLPDVGASVRSFADGKLLNARVDVEGLPPELHGLWSLADDGNASARFTTVDPDEPGADPDAGRPLGAIEARITNYDAAPASLVPFRPSQAQHVNYQRSGGDGGAQLITARIEKIRDARFALTPDGVQASTNIGDGVLPLELHVDTDELPGGDLLAATATIAPVPDRLAVRLANGTDGDLDDPFVLDYSASSSVDVTGHFETRKAAAAGDACGFPGTICADVDVRHLPSSIVTTIRQKKPETQVEVDAVPRPGGLKPDVYLTAVLGKQDGLDDPDLPDTEPTPLAAEAELRGISPHMRLRAVEGADETLERLDFLTCALTVDGDGKPQWDTGACQAGTQSPIEEINFRGRNFREVDRPAGLVAPTSTAPNRAVVQARGLDDTTETVRFEASGRIEDVDQVRMYNTDGIFGLRARAGGGRDLQTIVDIENVDFEGDDAANGRVDVSGRALVTPLPATLDLCMRQAGKALDLAAPVPFTDHCEDADPFGGDGPIEKSPLTFAYDAATAFSVEGGFGVFRHGTDDGPSDDHAQEATFDLRNVPAQLTAHVLTPGEKGSPTADDPARVLTKAPTTTDFDATLSFEDRRAGSSCDEPKPLGAVTCLRASIDDLPRYFSVLAESENEDSSAQVRACDFRFFAGVPMCRDGTNGEVKELRLEARMRTGDPSAVPAFVLAEHPLPSPAASPAPYFLEARIAQQSDDDLELRASGRMAQLRALTFVQGADGFDIHTDLGDNVTPLLSHVSLDTRNRHVPADPKDDEGILIVGDARVVPLPRKITISQRGPGADQTTDPLRFSYDSTAQVDLDAEARIIPVDAGGETCGSSRTACASLDLDRLPAHLEARVGNVITNVSGISNRVAKDVAFDLDAVPHPGQVGAQKPDLTAKAVLGEGLFEDLPPQIGGDGVPLVAEGTLTKIPNFVRVRLRGTEDFRQVPGGKRESVGSSVERFEIHTCDRDFTANTCNGTPDELESLTLSARNFFLRPGDFPHPTQNVTAANYAVVRGRGTSVEAAVKLSHIKEAQYVRREADGLVGLRTQIGGGGDLLVRADLKDVALGTALPLGDLVVDPATVDFGAEALVNTLPAVLDICFRQGGTKAPLPTPSNDFTAQCQDVNPFDATPADLTDNGLGHAPMSISYRSGANAAFNVFTKVSADIRGKKQGTNTDIAPRHLRGRLDVTGLPGKLEAHLLTPKDGATRGGPMRALVDSIRNPGDPLPATGPTIDLAGEFTLGDAVCQDPRIAVDVEAYCAKGRFANLPSVMTLFFDPDERFDNFKVETKGAPGTKMDWTGLELSAVRPVLQGNAVKLDAKGRPVADILVASGFLKGISRNSQVEGSLALPDQEGEGPAVDLSAAISIDEVKALVKNFIAPDPFGPVPARRSSSLVPLPAPADLPEQMVAFQQQGEKFKLDAYVKKLKSARYRTVVDSLGRALDTQVLGVDFAQDQSLRAFADIRPSESDPGNRILADALLGQIPAGIDICFRGKRTPGADPPIAGGGTFCDDLAPNGTVLNQVADDEGAIEVKFRSASAVAKKLDVDAELRMSKNFETDIIAARAQLTDIPHVIRGTIPAGDTGDLDIGLFDQNGQPDGIKRIEAEFATFDIFGTGWTPAQLQDVYTPYRRGDAPFPAPDRPDTNDVDTGGQYANVRVAGGDIHARVRLGDTAAGAGSKLQRVLMRKKACDAPPRPASARQDYPYFPALHNVPGVTGGQNEYLCIGAAFESAVNDHLATDVILDTAGGERLTLGQAGLTDIPGWLQLTYASSPTNGPAPQLAIRRPCGPAATEPAGTTDCAPPLIRFDQGNADNAAPTGILYGLIDFGRPVDLAKLDEAETDAREALASPDTAPGRTGAGWNDHWAADPRGARLKLVTIGDKKAIRAGVRLLLPGSLTVDAPATWEREAPKFPKDVATDEYGNVLNDDAKKRANWWSGTDIHIRFVSRDQLGNVLGTIGQASGVIHNYKDKSQLLLNGACAVRGDLGQFLQDIVNGAFGALVPVPGGAGFPFGFGPFPSGYTNVLRNVNPLRITQQCAGDTHHTKGLPIPGEVGLNLFLRSDGGEGRDYIQVDGRLSTKLSAGMRMLGGPDDPAAIGRLEAQLLNAPTTAGIADPSKASMRLRVEMLGERPEKLKSASDPPEVKKLPIVDLCGEAICFDASGTKIERVFASFDFQPTGQPVARRVDAVIDVPGKTTQGIELAGYTTVTGSTETPVGAVANLRINPLKLSMRDNFGKFVSDLGDAAQKALDAAGVGFLGDLIGLALDIIAAAINALVQLNLDLDAIFDGQVNLEATKHFTLKHNTLHLNASNAGPKHAIVGPLDVRIRELQAIANLGVTIPVPILPDIPIGVTLLNLFYVPSPGTFTPLGPEPMLLRSYECGVVGVVQAIPGIGDILTGVNDLLFPNLLRVSAGGSRNVVLWPLDDPRLVWGGALGPALQLSNDLLAPLISQIFCLAAGYDDLRLFSAGHPVNGVGTRAVGHPIPTDDTFAPPPGYVPPPAPDLPPTVAISQPNNTAVVSGTIDVVAAASDDDTSPTGLTVQLSVDGSAALQSMPYDAGTGTFRRSLDTTTLSAGNHTLRAIVTEPGKTPVQSGLVTVKVSNAPPPPTYPDFTLTADVALCGSHRFNKLVVPAGLTLRVATAYDATAVAAPHVTAARCAPAGPTDTRGTLQIVAEEVEVEGTVDGFGVMGTPPPNVNPAPGAPTGNGGAGHGGVGGLGLTDATVGPGGVTSGVGGAAYADATTAALGYTGSPANGFSGTDTGADRFGRGGGAVLINANTRLVVDGGIITVDGGRGESNATGSCGQAAIDNPPAGPGPEDQAFVARSGGEGKGGGSAGTIALTSARIEISGGGLVLARGGAGGDGRLGGGGGGAGGAVKVTTPVLLFPGATPPISSNGGGGGTDTCAASGLHGDYDDHGGSGASLSIAPVLRPSSALLSPGPSPWQRGAGLEVSYTARGAYQQATGFNVAVCGQRLPITTAVPAAPTPAEPDVLKAIFTLVPLAPTVASPCGGGQLLGERHVAPTGGVVSVPPPAAAGKIALSIGANPADNGYWGLYTVALRPATVGNDCRVPGDAGGVDDGVDCVLETIEVRPGSVAPKKLNPDQVVRIDNTPPAKPAPAPVTDPILSSPQGGTTINKTAIELTISVTDPLEGTVGLSGLRSVECRNGNTGPFQACDVGTRTWVLSPGDGLKTVQVRATDHAGNARTDSIQVNVDQNVKNASATLSTSPNAAGWYNAGSAPSITLVPPAEPNVIPGPIAIPYRFAHHFDAGDDVVCVNPCAAILTTGLPDGRHTFRYTAIDAAGNRYFDNVTDGSRPSPMQTALTKPGGGTISEVRIDRKAPATALLTAPQLCVPPVGPDQVCGQTQLGADHWFTTRPWVVLSAVDQFGASGVDKTRVKVERESPAGSGVFVTIMNDVVYTGPFQLDPGVHRVSFFSTDLAGNTEARAFAPVLLRVDHEAPSIGTRIEIPPVDGTPDGPDGLAGWYVTEPVGIAGSFTDGLGVGGTATPIRERLDNGPERACADPCTTVGGALTTGEHLYHASALDRLGNRRSELAPGGTRALKVDLVRPRTTILRGPTAPDGRNGWYHRSVWITLAAFDTQPGEGLLAPGSGVAKVEYRLAPGGYQTYTGPFRLDAGTHTVCVRATDVAGWTELDPAGGEHCQTVMVDLADPTAGVSAPAPNGGAGWYVAPTAATVSSADAAPGAGLGNDLTADVCSHRLPDNRSGTCVSVDGRPFVPVTGPLPVGEGDHVVESFSVDRSGRRSGLVRRRLLVDLSKPVPQVRLVPPRPAANGWWRTTPRVELRALDGDENSGVVSLRSAIDGPPTAEHTAALVVPSGLHTVNVAATDAAGNGASEVYAQPVRVDVTSPVITAVKAKPSIWLKLFSPAGNFLGFSPPTAELSFKVKDDLSSAVRVKAIVFNETGYPVRFIEKTVAVTPGVEKTDFVAWDGRDQSLFGHVPAGLYYFRVVAVDEAGNPAMSGESAPLQIKIG